jgi:hypothetical protein
MLDGWRLHKLNSKKFSPDARLLLCEALYNWGFLIVKKLRRRAIVKIVKCVRLSLRFL